MTRHKGVTVAYGGKTRAKDDEVTLQALRQPLRQISRDLDEALSQPAAAVGEKLASFAKSGEQLLERLRPSSRVQ